MNRAKLLAEYKRLKTDLKKSPSGVNYEGKPFPTHKTAYLLELERKLGISKRSK